MGMITAVLSTVPGDGAKFTAVELANQAVRDDKGVLLIDFDFDYPYLANELFQEQEESKRLDDLLAVMTGREILPERFLSFLVDTDMEIKVLRGTKLVGQKTQIKAEQVQGILQTAKELFDHVFVVVSRRADNMATPYTLAHADRTVLVVRQNQTNKGALPRVIRMIEEFYVNPSDVQIVYNYHNEKATVAINETFSKSAVGFSVAGLLAYDVKATDNVSLGRKSSLFSKSINERELSSIYEKVFRKGADKDAR